MCRRWVLLQGAPALGWGDTWEGAQAVLGGAVSSPQRHPDFYRVTTPTWLISQATGGLITFLAKFLDDSRQLLGCGTGTPLTLPRPLGRPLMRFLEYSGVRLDGADGCVEVGRFKSCFRVTSGRR